MPKMMQRDPALREALNHRHPLVECLINKDWQEHDMAIVIVVRSAPIGMVYSGFLVDLLGLGLKDVIGDYATNIIMGYLESDTISDVPFRRAAKRYPENFKTVIDYYAEQEGFETDTINDLMMTFKPASYDKLPSIVVVLDPEIANARTQA